MNPIEKLALAYLDTAGGDYEMVEPNVYDLLLPQPLLKELDLTPKRGDLCRVAFDAEALADYPEAQLMAIGHPSLDRIFAMAHEMGASGRVYLTGFNLHPHDVVKKLDHGFTLGKGLTRSYGPSRCFYFHLSFFWFQATFTSDEKVQLLFEVALDRYYGRSLHSLEELLAGVELTSSPTIPYPDRIDIPLKNCYDQARSIVLNRFRSALRSYKQQLSNHFLKESRQINHYYEELLQELLEPKRGSKEEDLTKIEEKKRALHLEKELRIIDLKKKLSLKTDFKLLHHLDLLQPKIVTPMELSIGGRERIVIDLIFDPHHKEAEAIPCPHCSQPTFALSLARKGTLHCPQCSSG